MNSFEKIQNVLNEIANGSNFALSVPEEMSRGDYATNIAFIMSKKENSQEKISPRDFAEKVLDLGFTMSFSGVFTFVKEYDEVLNFVPLKMMHCETDSPYVAPVPYRGKRNNPLYIEEVVKKIAEIKGLDVETVKKQLIINVKKSFDLA